MRLIYQNERTVQTQRPHNLQSNIASDRKYYFRHTFKPMDWLKTRVFGLYKDVLPMIVWRMSPSNQPGYVWSLSNNIKRKKCVLYPKNYSANLQNVHRLKFKLAIVNINNKQTC